MLVCTTRPLAGILTIALPLTAVTLGGCIASGPDAPVSPSPPAQAARSAPALSSHDPVRRLQPGLSPALRVGRYTLANTSPRADQLDLLNQVIDIRIPDQVNPTVHDAMNYVLRRSGYQLCAGIGSGTDGVQGLYAHPLPAAHYRLGPISIRNALLALAGPAWQMEVDERARRVCFAAHSDDRVRLPTVAAPTSVNAVTFPVPSPAGDRP
ncbi:PilL N-terminal domain-containing protein [Pseudomonas asplenii]|uniref:PFGI-1 class ICE element type IV pilus protein PilL2 n=1 Tax=Pseudomonas asplenii TaxID=53407 RepID=UPI0009B7ADB5|nr:PilL N-terminal domain-containing protein [Pseudomonas fuscovaginae]